MPKDINDVFFFENLVFENGTIDKGAHPVVVVARKDDKLYCFSVTSQIKHITDNSNARNTYNQQVKFVELDPDKNFDTDLNKKSLVNTLKCHIIDYDEAYPPKIFGEVTKESTRKDIILQWAFQQNEMLPERCPEYDEICRAFGITDSIKNDPLYVYKSQLLSNFPQERDFQRNYLRTIANQSEANLQNNRYNTSPPQGNQTKFIDLAKYLDKANKDQLMEMKKVVGGYEYNDRSTTIRH